MLWLLLLLMMNLLLGCFRMVSGLMFVKFCVMLVLKVFLLKGVSMVVKLDGCEEMVFGRFCWVFRKSLLVLVVLFGVGVGVMFCVVWLIWGVLLMLMMVLLFGRLLLGVSLWLLVLLIDRVRNW